MKILTLAIILSLSTLGFAQGPPAGAGGGKPPSEPKAAPAEPKAAPADPKDPKDPKEPPAKPPGKPLDPKKVDYPKRKTPSERVAIIREGKGSSPAGAPGLVLKLRSLPSPPEKKKPEQAQKVLKEKKPFVAAAKVKQAPKKESPGKAREVLKEKNPFLAGIKVKRVPDKINPKKELEENNPFLAGFKVKPVPEKIDPKAEIVVRKPFRHFSLTPTPRIEPPGEFEVKMALVWKPPFSLWMKQNLEEIQQAKKDGDWKAYNELTKKYTEWANLYLTP